MSYRLIFSKTSRKAVEKLDKVTKRRIARKISDYSLSPLTHAKKLLTPRIGAYRWRMGNYRVIFDIKDKDILVLKIGHRKDVYKK